MDLDLVVCEVVVVALGAGVADSFFEPPRPPPRPRAVPPPRPRPRPRPVFTIFMGMVLMVIRSASALWALRSLTWFNLVERVDGPCVELRVSERFSREVGMRNGKTEGRSGAFQVGRLLGVGEEESWGLVKWVV